MPPKTTNKYVLLSYYIKQHWLSYSLGVIAILATNWIAVSIPEYVRLSIDLLNNDLEVRQDLLWDYMLIMLCLAVVMIFVRTLSRILFFNPGRAIECQIKNDMFHKLMSLQKDYYEANPSGNIISRINNDITGVRMICGFGLMQSFNITSALSMTPFKMWQLSPSLTLYCIIPILLVFTAVRLGMHVLVRNMQARMESLQRLSGFTVSSLSAIDLIKSQTMRNWSKGRFEKENQDMLIRSMKIAWRAYCFYSVFCTIDISSDGVGLAHHYDSAGIGWAFKHSDCFAAESAKKSIKISSSDWTEVTFCRK